MENRNVKKENKKKRKNLKKLQNKSKQKNNKFFLSHCCQCPFPRWESQFTSPPQVALQHCVGLWTCYEGSLDSNLVLLLCVIVSNVHNYQNQCFLLWELSMSFYIFHRHRVCIGDCVDLICSLYSWWDGFGSSLATLPLGFNCGFISTSAGRSSTGLYS